MLLLLTETCSSLTWEVKKNHDEYLNNVSLSKTSSGGYSHFISIQLLHSLKEKQWRREYDSILEPPRENIKKVLDVLLYFHNVIAEMEHSMGVRAGIQWRMVPVLYAPKMSFLRQRQCSITLQVRKWKQFCAAAGAAFRQLFQLRPNIGGGACTLNCTLMEILFWEVFINSTNIYSAAILVNSQNSMDARPCRWKNGWAQCQVRTPNRLREP